MKGKDRTSVIIYRDWKTWQMQVKVDSTMILHWGLNCRKRTRSCLLSM